MEGCGGIQDVVGQGRSELEILIGKRKRGFCFSQISLNMDLTESRGLVNKENWTGKLCRKGKDAAAAGLTAQI